MPGTAHAPRRRPAAWFCTTDTLPWCVRARAAGAGGYWCRPSTLRHGAESPTSGIPAGPGTCHTSSARRTAPAESRSHRARRSPAAGPCTRRGPSRPIGSRTLPGVFQLRTRGSDDGPHDGTVVEALPDPACLTQPDQGQVHRATAVAAGRGNGAPAAWSAHQHLVDRFVTGYDGRIAWPAWSSGVYFRFVHALVLGSCRF